MNDNEIIQTAARVIRDHVQEVSIQNWSPRSEAEAVLAAVEPLIREQIAKDIENATLDATFMSEANSHGWWAAVDAAARIARRQDTA